MLRRHFIKRSLTASALLATTPYSLWPADEEDFLKLTILHTNDTHSRIEPFPDDGSRNAGLGGVARRSALIDSIRKEEDHVLLLDSGDIFQGTPYFNKFLGELEFKLMSRMGYNAATIGNHDFDGGVQNLADQMRHASFSMVSSNYDFSDTPMHDKALPHKVLEIGGLKVGLCGAGIELEGLVALKMYGDTRYLDPVRAVNRTARKLKREYGCHYVICLSHLGYRYRSNKVSDVVLAEASENVDLILGGHTHTFMDEPDVRANSEGKEVIIHQVGWAGILLGRIDVVFERNSKLKCVTCGSQKIS